MTTSSAPVEILLVVAPKECRKCAECEALVGRLQADFPGRITFRKVPADSPEADFLGVVMPPVMVVNDLVVSMGKVPQEQALRNLLDRQ